MNMERITSLHPEIFEVGFYSDDVWFHVWQRSRPDEGCDLTLAAPWERGELVARYVSGDSYSERPLSDFAAE